MAAFGYVEEFVHHERAAGRAAATLRNRRAALEPCLEWLETQGKSDQTATSGDLVGYLNTLVDRYTPDHVNQVVSGLRVYFRWLVEEGIRRDGANPAARLKYLRAPAKPVESLTDVECRKLVRWATTVAPRARYGVHRTGMLALLLLDTGLRIGEALRLTIGDLDFDEGKVLVRRTKTGDFRVVPMSPLVRKHLRRYLRHREQRLAKLEVESEHVFLSEAGEPCGILTAERAFRGVGKVAGIRRIHPHLLRHTFATEPAERRPTAGRYAAGRLEKAHHSAAVHLHERRGRGRGAQQDKPAGEPLSTTARSLVAPALMFGRDTRCLPQASGVSAC